MSSLSSPVTITKGHMMDLMLEACPTFRSSWESFTDKWKDENGEPPIYLALADLARHLISMLARGETASFRAVFDVVERWHVDGDDQVREAATVGLLEGLQNTNLHDSTVPEDFRRFLHPVSERWWDKLYAFWERGELLRDDEAG